MSRKLTAALNILRIICQFLFFYSLLLTLTGLDTGHRLSWISGFWIAPVLLFSAALHWFYPGFWIFFLLNLGQGVLIIPFSHTTAQWAFNIIIFLIISSVSLAARTDREGMLNRGIPGELYLLYIPMFIAASYYGYRGLQLMITASVLVSILITYFDIYGMELYKSLVHQVNGREMGVSRVFQTSMMVFVLFITVFLLCAGAVYFLPLGDMVKSLLLFLRDILVYPVRFILYLLALHNRGSVSDLADFSALAGAAGKGQLLRHVMEVMQYILVIFIVYVCIRAFLKFLIWVFQYLSKSRALPVDQVSFIAPKERRKKEKGSVSRSADHVVFRGESGRIRRMFRRVVLEHFPGGNGIYRSATARSLASQMEAMDEIRPPKDRRDAIDYGELTRAYEEVRYGRGDTRD